MVVYLCNIACLTGMWFLLSNYRKDKNRIFCFFASLNWILISGLRGLSVGDDTKAYKEQFTNIKKYKLYFSYRTVRVYNRNLQTLNFRLGTVFLKHLSKSIFIMETEKI